MLRPLHVNPNNPVCAFCRFWHKKDGNPIVGQVPQGECRRFPPTTTLLPGPGGQAAGVTMFPTVAADAWCGEQTAMRGTNAS